MPPKGADEVSPRSGVKRPRPARSRRSGLFRAPARATFVCGDKSSQNPRLDLRSKNPSRAILSCDFPRILAGIAFHHRCQSKGLRVRSPARRLTRPLASATAEIFRSCRRTPKPSPRVAHPLEPSPLMGRGVSGAPSSLPLEGKVPPKGADEVSPRSGVKRPRPARRQCPPNTTAASAATYPLRCFAPQWARFDNRQRLQRTRFYPRTASAAAAQEVQAVP